MKKIIAKKLLQGFIFVSLFSLTLAHASTENEAVLEFAGKKFTLSNLLKLVKEKSLTVIEPHLNDHVTYIGLPLVDLLNKIAGPDWQKADGLLYSCLDGYKSDISVQKILLFKPLLAFKRKDGAAFTVDSKAQNEKNVQLGPFYLVWDNIAFPILISDAAYGWPYQIASIRFIQYSDYYAKTFPFKNIEESVYKAGFETTKNYCMSCHAFKDEGGLKGPPLWPNPEVIKKGYPKFEEWVLNPSSVKPGTTMPPLNPKMRLKDRKIAAKRIFDYLSALNRLKDAPEKTIKPSK